MKITSKNKKIKEFDQNAEEIIRTHGKNRLPCKEAHYCHYTNYEDGESILSKNELHLSDIQEMESEKLQKAMGILQDCLSDPSNKKSAIFQSLMKKFEKKPIQEILDIYIGSFSTKSDNVDLWNAFGGIENQNDGFMIEFDPELFKANNNFTRDDIKKHGMKAADHVIYDENAFKAIVNELIKLADKIFMRLTQYTYAKRIDIGFVTLSSTIISLLPSYVDDTYENEGEYRIFQIGWKDSSKHEPKIPKDLRRKNNKVAFSFETRHVRKIIIGKNSKITTEDLKEKLTQWGYDVSKIDISKQKHYNDPHKVGHLLEERSDFRIKSKLICPPEM